MRYEKPASTVEEQIDLLIRRGMTVADRALARHHLSHIGYYRLRAYWLPFEVAPDGGEHRFCDETTFERALNCYTFDRELRLLVLDAVERIEVSVRSQWVYHLARAHGAHAHLDGELFLNGNKYSECLKSIDKEIGRSREVFIKHLCKKYDEPRPSPPLWAVVEIMSLGQFSKWYENLNRPLLRQKVADVYGMDEKIMSSFLHHLALVRNLCAHHSRLWNRHFTFTVTIPRKKPKTLAPIFNRQTPRQIYNTLVLIAHLMAVIAPQESWKNRLLALLDKHGRDLAAPMGFPADWQLMNFWRAENDAEKESPL